MTDHALSDSFLWLHDSWRQKNINEYFPLAIAWAKHNIPCRGGGSVGTSTESELLTAERTEETRLKKWGALLTFARTPCTMTVPHSLASTLWPCVWRPAHMAASGRPASPPSPRIHWAWNEKKTELKILKVSKCYAVLFQMYNVAVHERRNK